MQQRTPTHGALAHAPRTQCTHTRRRTQESAAPEPGLDAVLVNEELQQASHAGAVQAACSGSSKAVEQMIVDYTDVAGTASPSQLSGGSHCNCSRPTLRALRPQPHGQHAWRAPRRVASPGSSMHGASVLSLANSSCTTCAGMGCNSNASKLHATVERGQLAGGRITQEGGGGGPCTQRKYVPQG